MAKDVKIRISATDATKTVFSSVARGMKAIGSVAATALRGIRNLGIAGGIAFAGLIKNANEFRKGMAEVNTLIDGGGIEGLTSQVIDLSAELGIAKSELVGGLYQALSAGVPKDNVMDFLKVSAKAAIGGVATTKESVSALTTIMDTYNLKAEDASIISDKLFTTVKNGKINFSELARGIGDVAGISAGAGISLDELFGTIAAGSKVTTPLKLFAALRASLAGVLAPGDELQKVFKKLGTTGEAMVRSNGLAGALKVISGETGGSFSKLKELIPSIEALPLLIALSGENAEKSDKQISDMAKSLGKAQDAYEKMKGVKAWDRLWQQILRPIAKMGIIFDEKLSPSADKIGKAIEKWQASAGFSVFIDTLKTRLDQLGVLAEDIFAGGKKKDAAINKIKNKAREIGDVIADVFISRIPDVAKALGAAMVDVAIPVAEGVAMKTSETINPLHGLATGLGSAIQKASSPNAVAQMSRSIGIEALPSSQKEIVDAIERTNKKLDQLQQP